MAPTDTPKAPAAPAPAPTVGAGVAFTIVQQPAKLASVDEQSAQFTVRSGPRGVHGLRVLAAALDETSAMPRRIDGRAIQLCARPIGACPGSIDLAPEQQSALFLRIDPSAVTSGNYVGPVVLAAAELTEPTQLSWTVYVTSWPSRVLGAGAIALGILLAWVMAAVVRQRSLRNEALAPAATLGDATRRLQHEVETVERTAQVKLDATRDVLSNILTAIRPSQLEARGLVPPSLANPFRPLADRSDALKAYLADLEEKLRAEDTIVRRGIVVALTLADPSSQAAKVAVQQLDALSGNVTAASALQAIDPILAPLRQPEVEGLIAGRRTQPTDAVPTVLALQLRSQHLSGWAWFVWGLLTWLLGLVTLIATNYGFGTGLDFFKCFFWGLGVQIAGQQLQQLTPSTVGTALSVSLPR